MSPLRKALNAGSAYARLSSCNRFQGRPTHWAMLRIHPKPIERAQDPWNPRVVKRFCPVAGSSLIGNAPDCSHCLNCRFLFSAYAPLPVPEALLPITPLALWVALTTSLGSAMLALNLTLRARLKKLLLRKTQALTGFWSLLALGQNPCGFRITRKGIRAHTKYLGGHHEQRRAS